MKKLYKQGAEPREPKIGLGLAGLHLGALSSFAIAWQYFEPLSHSGELFIEHGFSGVDIVLFALGLVVLPPLVLLAVEGVAGIVSLRLREALHLFFIGGFVALILWQIVFGMDPGMSGSVIYPLALLAGAAGALAYWRVAPVRLWLSVLSVGPVMVLVLFLVLSPIRAIALGSDGPPPVRDIEARAPVVMVVLDELPVTSLMAEGGRIDDVRYPNFAALAREGTWYRNAASVGDYTKIAVPAILTGRTPTPGVLPVAGEHPDNLFRLLGGSYRLDVMEWLTRLCGEPVCPNQEGASVVGNIRELLGDLQVARIPALPPAVSFRLAGRLRPSLDSAGGPPEPETSERSVRRDPNLEQEDRLEYFVSALEAGRGPTLDFLHLLLPHHAWVRLPSGQRYAAQGSPFALHPAGDWSEDPNFTAVAFQRHLLQVAYVDRLIGQVVSRLKTLGTYDRSLIVVTADHGVSFRAGEGTRTATRANAGDIASVPLFVKAPGQRRGGVDDSFVESTDILATVAKHLGIALPWKTSGEPADEVGHRRQTLRIQRESEDGPLEVTRTVLAQQRQQTLTRKLSLFGTGGDGDSMFVLAGGPALIDRSPARFTTAATASAAAVVTDPQRYRDVDPAGADLPAEVNGEITGDRARRRRIAVAVNGRVAATGWTFRVRGREYYSAVCLPSTFRRGENRIEVYELLGGRRAPKLAPMSR